MYATPEAAKSFDDNLENVAAQGIKVISEDEAQSLGDSVTQLELRDFDFGGIARSFGEFGVPLDDLAAVAVAVFDHGAAPPDVFDDHGHGALIYDDEPLPFGEGDFDVVVTGPRRSMFHTTKDGIQKTGNKLSPSTVSGHPSLRPYFPAPFGDMMITGCFGLLSAVADLRPELADPIQASLSQMGDSGIAPWDVS